MLPLQPNQPKKKATVTRTGAPSFTPSMVVAPSEVRMVVSSLSPETREELFIELAEMAKFIEDVSDPEFAYTYEKFLDERGYTPDEIKEKRESVRRAFADLRQHSADLPSYIVSFELSLPQDIQQSVPSEAEHWYKDYSNLIEAMVGYKVSKKLGLSPQHPLVDRLLVGSAFAFGHTSRRTGVTANFFADSMVLEKTIDAIDEIIREYIQRGEKLTTEDFVEKLRTDEGFRKRFATKLLAKTNVIQVDESGLPVTETRTKTKKEGIFTVLGIKPPVGSETPQGKDISALRGNVADAVQSMVYTLMGRDADEAIRFGASVFSEDAKKTLNYSYQIISTQKYATTPVNSPNIPQYSMGATMLPHMPLTVRDVWETAGTLGQLRVISAPDESGRMTLDVEALRDVYVPLGFDIVKEGETFKAVPIEAYWDYVKNNPHEQEFIRSLVYRVAPPEDIPIALLPDVAGETPVFKSEQASPVVRHLFASRQPKETIDDVKDFAKKQIETHINAMNNLHRYFSFYVDPNTGMVSLAITSEQAERIAKETGYDPREMASHQGVSVVGDTVIFNADRIRDIVSDPNGGTRLQRFADLVNKKINGNADLFAGFAPSLLETYTTNSQEYRNNIRSLRQTMEAELNYTRDIPQPQPTKQPKPSAPAPKRRLREIFSDILTPQATQQTQAKCWVGYRNAVLKSGATKAFASPKIAQEITVQFENAP